MLQGYGNQIESFMWLIFRLPAWLWLQSLSVAVTLGISPDNDKARAIIFVAIVSLVETVRGIPWDLYETFVIKQRHGFNQSTLR